MGWWVRSLGKAFNLFLNCVMYQLRGLQGLLETLHLRLCPVPTHPHADFFSQPLATAAVVLNIFIFLFLAVWHSTSSLRQIVTIKTSLQAFAAAQHMCMESVSETIRQIDTERGGWRKRGAMEPEAGTGRKAHQYVAKRS